MFYVKIISRLSFSTIFFFYKLVWLSLTFVVNPGNLSVVFKLQSTVFNVDVHWLQLFAGCRYLGLKVKQVCNCSSSCSGVLSLTLLRASFCWRAFDSCSLWLWWGSSKAEHESVQSIPKYMRQMLWMEPMMWLNWCFRKRYVNIVLSISTHWS